MSDPFANYDAWLERPYQQAYADAEAFEAFEDEAREELGPDASDADVAALAEELAEADAQREAEDRAEELAEYLDDPIHDYAGI